MNINQLINLATENGLVFRGGFSASEEDEIPPQRNGQPSQTLLLFGQAGYSLWPVFKQSLELADGHPHPLDRWSERVGHTIAEKLNGTLLLPFGEAPHHPFIRWASRIEDVQPSRLGMLIHPTHGLWHAYRFAIAIAEQIENLPELETHGNICEQCQTQPCLKKCPVNAFDGTRYDVSACFRYLQENPESLCQTSGCQARDACPEGAQSHYPVEQKQFHMKQFMLSLQRTYDQGKNS